MSLPPSTLLKSEEAVGGPCPVEGGLRLCCGQRALRCHQQQFGLPVGPARDLLDVTDRGIRLGQRIADQPGCQQNGTAVDTEGWRRYIQRPVAGSSFINKCERRGKIS